MEFAEDSRYVPNLRMSPDQIAALVTSPAVESLLQTRQLQHKRIRVQTHSTGRSIQFSDGLSTRSITVTSIGSFVPSSLSPSVCSRALNKD